MTPILPRDLEGHWPFVVAGLQEIIKRTGEKWTPTHVRQGVNEGWAYLYVEEDGFCVLQVSKREWTSDPYLNVWAFWFKPDMARDRWREFFAWLDDMAARAGVGFRNWEFGSPREGWGCKTLRDEIEVVRVIYRRKNG